MKLTSRTHLVLAAIAVAAVLATGCGGVKKSATSDSGAGVEPSPPTEHEATYATYRHDEPGDVEPAGVGAPATVSQIRSGDPQPPDLDVTTSDTLVQRRDRVDVTARTTADAVEVVLWDGIGDRQTLTYDESANLWRGSYRVPLRAPDRHGLSVTARNSANQWRRVWVFLDLTEEQPAAVVDSSSMTGEVSK